MRSIALIWGYVLSIHIVGVEYLENFLWTREGRGLNFSLTEISRFCPAEPKKLSPRPSRAHKKFSILKDFLWARIGRGFNIFGSVGQNLEIRVFTLPRHK